MSAPQLTRRQIAALCVLSTRGPSTATDQSAWWPTLDPGSQVGGILGRLERRGLVEQKTHEFGYDGRMRIVWAITASGEAAIDGLDAEEIAEEEE